MTATDLTDLDIATLSDLVRRGDISPVDITEATLARIDRVDRHYGAFISLAAERAMDAARAAEATIRGDGPIGPLHGIPMAVKDLFRVAGMERTNGSAFLREDTTGADATSVARLKAAGAIIIGTLNLHEFAFGPTGVNPHHGTARNPWNRDLISGGSSSGSGCAVAARMVPAALGTDTGGSVRIPAAPLRRRRPQADVRSGQPGRHLSPLGKFRPRRPPHAERTRLRPRPRRHRRYRPGGRVDPRRPGRFLRPAPRRKHGRFADRGDERISSSSVCTRRSRRRSPRPSAFSRTSAPTSRRSPCRSPRRAPGLGTPIALAEAWIVHAGHVRDHGDALSPDVKDRLLLGQAITADDVAEARAVRERVQGEMAEVLTRVDVLAMPTTLIPAVPVDTCTIEVDGATVDGVKVLGRLTRLAAFTGQPAVSVPCGFTSDDLPIGLQLAGDWFGEADLLAAADAYERAAGWQARRPPEPP